MAVWPASSRWLGNKRRPGGLRLALNLAAPPADTTAMPLLVDFPRGQPEDDPSAPQVLARALSLVAALALVGWFVFGR